jgi:hypothetical protein
MPKECSLESDISIQGNRMNLVMKKVTSLAAIAAVPTADHGFLRAERTVPGLPVPTWPRALFDPDCRRFDRAIPELQEEKMDLPKRASPSSSAYNKTFTCTILRAERCSASESSASCVYTIHHTRHPRSVAARLSVPSAHP